jgi:para-nitrobenzyl esterase
MPTLRSCDDRTGSLGAAPGLEPFRPGSAMRTPSKLLIPALAFSAMLISIGREKMYGRGVGCLASTSNGSVQGVDLGSSCAFLGIPFAASTANQNRWKPPQPAAPWAPAILNAITAPPNCASLSAAGAPQGSEDCLKLNVWVRNPVPADAPVIVWIHTGSFVGASANFAGTNGRRLAEETGVIVVEANYRLAAFGFLAHGAFEREDPDRPSAGNYGLLDQQAALEWVHDNIAGFAGDPDNVTLAGTSAGGESVGLHLVSPRSAGLFHRAIVESGYPTTAWRTRDDGRAQGDALATSLGCTNPAQVLSCLRSKTQTQILLALPQAAPQVVEAIGRAVWEPVVDGIVIPDQPRTLLEQGEFAHVPTIIGTDRDEAWGPLITRSFPSGVSLAQYEAWVTTEFGTAAPRVLAMYPASDFASPQEAMSRLVTDGQFVCEARRLGDLIADGGLRGRGPHPEHDTGKRIKMPVYMYSYDYVLNDLSVGHVIHGLESNMVFGNGYTTPTFAANHALTPADVALHDVMAGYWTLFAATGDPNGGGLPAWLEYRKNHDNYLVFDSVLSAEVDQRSDACEFWWSFFFQSMLGGVTAATP